jgi:RHS repeat-associated protein
MLVPNRYSEDDYRYGFQGQEKDDEIKGDKGKSLNYTFRMHDPRVGRFFAVDPLAVDYPHNTPYAFSENRVLDRNELEGLETGPQYWMAHTPAAKSVGMTPQMWEKQNSNIVGRKVLEAIKNKVLKANRRAENMSTFYQQNKYLLSRDEQLTFGVSQIYFGSYFQEFAGFTDAEDVSVIMEGRTIDGKKFFLNVDKYDFRIVESRNNNIKITNKYMDKEFDDFFAKLTRISCDMKENVVEN